MPFRSPGAGSRSGTSGRDGYLSVPPGHKPPRGRDRLFSRSASSSPRPQDSSRRALHAALLDAAIRLGAEVPQETWALAERAMVLNAKMNLTFLLQTKGSTCESGRGSRPIHRHPGCSHSEIRLWSSVGWIAEVPVTTWDKARSPRSVPLTP